MPLALTDILFAIAALAVLGLSLSVVLARNPVRSTLLLILSFVPVSLLYILLQASFVGVLQILVYAGAILMLFTFVIMMINPAPLGGEVPDNGFKPRKSDWGGTLAQLLLLLGAALILIPPVYRAALQIPAVPVDHASFGSLRSVAQLIFTDPAENPLTVSFELISFLILVGVIAAINFSRRHFGIEGENGEGK